ncbi:MAG: zinc ribbon domain-containing protein [Proteobacteria bacterium]|nr:zinc ribbon domain-containing protein [Pseudomonadota bacterium]
MPFYEYQCKACSAQIEVLQKISDAPLRKCTSCGKSQLTKLISAPVFRLKGSGWYETDFKGEGDRKRNLAGADTDTSAPAAEADKPAVADKPADATPAAKPVEAANPSASKSATQSKSPAKSPAKPKPKPKPKAKTRK